MKPLAIFGIILFIASIAVSGWLWWWTYRTFYPPLSAWAELEAKPWLPWTRLAFSAVMIVGMFTVSVFVISKTVPHCDD